MGLISFELGDLDAAEDYYRRALKVKPDLPAVWVNLSTVLIAREDYPAAEEACRRALEYAPEFSMAYNNLAVALYYQGRKEEARQALNRAKELGYPVNPNFEKLVQT